MLRIQGSGRFTGRGIISSILSLPASTVTKAIRPGIKLYIKPNLTISLEEQFIEILLKESEESNFKKLYHEWLEETGSKELIDEKKLKKSRERLRVFDKCDCALQKLPFCKPQGMNLCPKCRSKYKSVNYETCFACLTKEKRSFGKGKIAKLPENSEIPSMLLFSSYNLYNHFQKKGPSRFLHIPCKFHSQKFRNRYKEDILLQAEQRVHHHVPRKLHKFCHLRTRFHDNESIFPERIQCLYSYEASYHL